MYRPQRVTLTRRGTQCMLKDYGDFLVRMTEPVDKGQREYVISVMFDKDKDVVRCANATRAASDASLAQVKHFVIRHRNERYSIDNSQDFPTVIQLINHYRNTRKSLSKVRRPRRAKLTRRGSLTGQGVHTEDASDATRLAARPLRHRRAEEAGRRRVRRGTVAATRVSDALRFTQVCLGTLILKEKGGPRAIPVAIKVAKLDNLTNEQIKEIMREV